MPRDADDVALEYCPVSIGAGLVAERWSLLIVRELLDGSSRFNDIQRGLPGLSRTTLVSRLRHLERIGVITARTDEPGYLLTDEGRALGPLILALGKWTVDHHLSKPTQEQSDPALITWRVSQRLQRDRLPAGRLTLEFSFPDVRSRVWMLLRDRRPSVRTDHPGIAVDLVVAATADSWNSVWSGSRSLASALGSGDLELRGLPTLAAAFPTWLAGTGAEAQASLKASASL